jgi:beta-lactamase regulating signal transducer with metallopeptidase domain
MNQLEILLLGPRAILLLANIAVVVSVILAVGLMMVQLSRRRSAPSQYAILLCTLALVTAAPAVVVIAEAAKFGWVRVAFEANPVADPPAMSNISVTGERSPITDSVNAEEMELSSSREPPRAFASPRVSWVVAGGALLAVAWGAGSLVNSLLLLRSLVRLIRFRQGLRERASQQAAGAAARLASRIGLARPPRLFVSARVTSPVAIGLFSPVIVLPRGFQEEVDRQQLDDVLLHELAHLARRDHWVGLVQRLAKVLYWWCPLIYAVHRKLRALREEICDNYVLRHDGDGTRFAKLLLDLAERAASMPTLPVSTGLFDTIGDLEQRVQRLLSKETNTMVRTRAGARFVLAIFFVATAAAAAVLTVRAEGQHDAIDETLTENLHTLPKDPKAVILLFDFLGRQMLAPRVSDEPHLKILADGTAVAGAPYGKRKRLTAKLSAQHVQQLLRFVLDEQRFREINDKDVGIPAGAIVSDAQRAVVEVQCDGKRHQVRFIPGIDISRAASEGEESPAARILAIRLRLSQVSAEMHAGGKQGIAEHLQKVNARLRAEHKDVPPLAAADLQDAARFADKGLALVGFEREEKLAGGKTRYTRATIQYRPRSEPTIVIAVRVDGE